MVSKTLTFLTFALVAAGSSIHPRQDAANPAKGKTAGAKGKGKSGSGGFLGGLTGMFEDSTILEAVTDRQNRRVK